MSSDTVVGGVKVDLLPLYAENVSELDESFGVARKVDSKQELTTQDLVACSAAPEGLGYADIPSSAGCTQAAAVLRRATSGVTEAQVRWANENDAAVIAQDLPLWVFNNMHYTTQYDVVEKISRASQDAQQQFAEGVLLGSLSLLDRYATLAHSRPQSHTKRMSELVQHLLALDAKVLACCVTAETLAMLPDDCASQLVCGVIKKCHDATTMCQFVEQGAFARLSISNEARAAVIKVLAKGPETIASGIAMTRVVHATAILENAREGRHQPTIQHQIAAFVAVLRSFSDDTWQALATNEHARRDVRMVIQYLVNRDSSIITEDELKRWSRWLPMPKGL